MAFGHPTDEMLAAYAAGTSSEGIALLVAAHLTYCPACRSRVAALESLSAAGFGEAEPIEPEAAVLAATLARLDEPAPAEARLPSAAPAVPALPRPILAALDGNGIRWRFRMPGVSECALDLGGQERVSLLRVRPGAGVPAHTHTATEVTLVLQGVLCDREARYGRGTVAIATPHDDHHPHAGDGEDCLCLTVLDGGLRFTGTFGRALNIFAE